MKISVSPMLIFWGMRVTIVIGLLMKDIWWKRRGCMAATLCWGTLFYYSRSWFFWCSPFTTGNSLWYFTVAFPQWKSSSSVWYLGSSCSGISTGNFVGLFGGCGWNQNPSSLSLCLKSIYVYSGFQIDKLHHHNQTLVGTLHATSLPWSTHIKTTIKLFEINSSQQKK